LVRAGNCERFHNKDSEEGAGPARSPAFYFGLPTTSAQPARNTNEEGRFVVLSPDKLAGPPAQVGRSDSGRQRCRKCRAWLAVLADNPREAFCSRGCHVQFYRTRCRICEEPIEQPARGARLICDRAACRSAWRAALGLGRYHTPNFAESIPEVPVNSGSKVGIDDDRGWSWRVVAAGAAISANQYHCAIVGAANGIAAANRTNAAHRLAAKRREEAPRTRGAR
jgi:hypothetical protein